MKQCITRLTALLLTLGLALSMAIGVSAADTSYRVNVKADKTVEIINGSKVKRYKALKTNLTIRASTKTGAVSVSFPTTGGTVGLSLGKQTSLTVTGTMSELTLDKSLSSAVEIEMQGVTDALTVNGPVTLTIASKADVATIKVVNTLADVRVEKGATVKETYAADKKTVTGVSKVFGLSTAPSTNKTTPETSTANQQGKIETYLDISYRDKDTENCKNISIDGAYEVSLEAKPGISLTGAMHDLKLRVERAEDSSKAVSGTWKWQTGGYETKTSGIYYYQFTPSVPAQYAPITLKVNYTSNGASTLEKVGLSFSDGQRSHGAVTDSISIDVAIPRQVSDDDILEIFVDNKKTADSPYYLSESDAGEVSSFTVQPDLGVAGDKVKIKVRVKRSVGGGSTSSKTITYQFD